MLAWDETSGATVKLVVITLCCHGLLRVSYGYGFYGSSSILSSPQQFMDTRLELISGFFPQAFLTFNRYK